MKRPLIALLSLTALLGSAGLLNAQQPNIGDLTRELTGERPAAQRSPEQLQAAYTQVIDSLMSDLGNDDAGRRGNGQRTLERIAFNASRPGAEAERAALSKTIAAKLGGEVSPLASSWMIRQLERIGQAEAVPQLAKLLDDKDAQVRECARRALLKNPSPEAGQALRAALTSADIAWRTAIINALGTRHETADLPVLLKEAASDNDDIRIAAMRGLAKIGDRSAAAVLAAAMAKGSPAAKTIAADTYLLLADSLANNGQQADALGIYRSMLTSPGYLKCAAIIGIGRAGSATELPLVLAALPGADARLQGSCVDALALLQGANVTATIADKAKTADADTKPALLQALVRRGDKSTAPVLVAALDDANESVRIEALRGLAVLGDASTVPLLLKAAVTSGPVQDAARQSLERLPGDPVDKALIAAIDQNDVKVRSEVVRALAGRRVVAATAALLKSAEDADGGVRNESLKALAAVAPTDALPAIAALLVKALDDAGRNEAANALARIAGRDADLEKRAEPVLKALQSSSGPAKLALLGVLGRIGGDTSLSAVRAALKDPDAKVADAALRALADWPDVAAAEDLLTVAKNATDQTQHVLAIRGYIRVCRLENSRPTSQNAAMLASALETARRPGEKRQALGGLAEVRHIAALNAVVPCLDNADLAQEACQAAVRIGRDIVDRNAQPVRVAMQKVLEVSKNPDIQKQAKETLDRAEQKLN